MLRIRLFGEIAVEADGRAVDLPSGRTRSLLAWLALNRGSHFRAEVAARFWPDILDASARASLRTALWTLRRTLGPAADSALIATRDRVGISAGPVVWTDAAAFDDLLAAGRLEEAVELAGDDELLAGLDDDWVLEARDDRVDRVASALGSLASGAESAGDLRRAIAWTRRQLAVDPLAEEAHRDLIRRLGASGDRVRALESYERLRERLRSELGLTPSPATRALVDDLRSGGEQPEPRPAGTEGVASGGSTRQRATTIGDWAPGARFPLPSRLGPALDGGPLIGRDRELTDLHRALIESRASSAPRFLLVRGESGIGKTRLLAEISRLAGAQGAITLYGTAEPEAFTACRPFVEALDHYVACADPAELRARVGSRGAELAQLLPELGRRLPEIGASSDTELGLAPALEAVVSLLSGLSEQMPTLLVLDDIHWLDAASAVLLRDMFASWRGGPLLVIGGCREQEVSPSGAMARTLGDLRGAQHSDPLQLEGLGPDEVDKLCRAHASAPRLSASIHAATDGNPLFVREILRHLDETGDAPGPPAALPAGLRELIERRLSRLSVECVQALRIGGVIGRELELTLLERVSGRPGDELAHQLDEAVRMGLLVEIPDAFERFRFSHALVREALVDDLTGTRRARIHVRIAEALEEMGEDDDAPSPTLAHHWCEAGRAGDPDRAIELAMRAAERATSRHVHGEAVELYNRALALTGDDDARRRPIMLRRAVAYQRLEHFVFVRVHGVRASTGDGENREPGGSRSAPRLPLR